MASQQYGELSHALQPPVNRSPSTPAYAQYGAPPPRPTPLNTANGTQTAQREEDEEEEDAEESPQDHPNDLTHPEQRTAQNGTQARPTTSAVTVTHAGGQANAQTPVDGQGLPIKRKPGRPKGSKTKKRHADAPNEGSISSAPKTGPSYPEFNIAPPPILQGQHPEVNAHNQQYYEFQWRVLNLCSEFYNAAEELVKATSPLVITQSYTMGPSVAIDPLALLNEAKRNCDALLANPSQLVSRPPPPIFPTIPQWGNHYAPPPHPGMPGGGPPPPTMVHPPQSFVMPLGPVPAHHQPPPPAAPYHPGYAAAAASRYPPSAYYPPAGSSYYTYAAHPPNGPPHGQPPAPSHTPAPSTSTPAPAGSGPPPPGGGSASAAQGPPPPSRVSRDGVWTEEGTERARATANDSRTERGTEWDAIVARYGAGHGRPPILPKPTSPGPKDARANKASREEAERAALRAGPPVTWPMSAPAATPGEQQTSYYHAAISAQHTPTAGNPHNRAYGYLVKTE